MWNPDRLGNHQHLPLAALTGHVHRPPGGRPHPGPRGRRRHNPRPTRRPAPGTPGGRRAIMRARRRRPRSRIFSCSGVSFCFLLKVVTFGLPGVSRRWRYARSRAIMPNSTDVLYQRSVTTLQLAGQWHLRLFWPLLTKCLLRIDYHSTGICITICRH